MKMQTRFIIAMVTVAALAAGLLLLRATRRDNTTDATLSAAFDAEFLTRPDGYLGLQAHYDLTFPYEPKQMEPGMMYRALADGAVDVIDAFATDGRIPAYGLKPLRDDKAFFPPYFAAPLARRQTLEQHPELVPLLHRLAGRIDDETMQGLNFQADEQGRKAVDIARDFLVSEGLLTPDARAGDGSGETLRIGSKHFTEQEILGELLAVLIEHATDLRVQRRLNLGGTMICFNALKSGDIDLYVEYTGTGLVNILQEDTIHDPQAAYDRVKTAFADQFDLTWLQPLGFNNTYTLTMRAAQAEALDLETISDLAAYLRAEGLTR